MAQQMESKSTSMNKKKLEYQIVYHRRKGTLLQHWISVMLPHELLQWGETTHKTQHKDKHSTSNFLTPPHPPKKQQRESLSVLEELR